MKTADKLVKEIGLAVQPPRHVAIVLTEDPGSQPNWVADAAIMDSALTDKFSQTVAELRNTGPFVDWSGVKRGPERSSPRRKVLVQVHWL